MIGLPATTTEQTSIANNILMRLYILILFILFSFSLSGQHMMLAGGTQAAPPVEGLLLDDYPGAVAAYSLRELSTAWSGLDVIRVRESGSNTEQDFTAAEITDGTLSAFCGANDGFVVTWYDQSGQGNDVTQSTSGNQPKIYDGTAGLNFKNGKPSLSFDGSGSGNYFNLSTSDFGGNLLDLFIVGSVDTYDINGSIILASTNSPAVFYQFGTITKAYYQGNYLINGINIDDNQQRLLELYSDGASRYAVYNSDEYSVVGFVPVITSGLRSYMLGKYPGDSWNWDGQLQEIVIYATNQFSSRDNIETNINTYYSIY